MQNKIEYREAVFDVFRTLSWERTRVKDSANNYLHTHWDFTVQVNWQPKFVSYGKNDNDPAPFIQKGNFPGETDVALLSRILQPRGFLKVTAGNFVILESPAIEQGVGTRMPCDVMGGPSVEMVGVPQMIGVRHWIITLHFIADVRDQVNPIPQHLNAVLSNIWVSTEDIDLTRRSIRRFAGRAILRADVMRSASINANSLRDLFLFPCPDHYQRTNVGVQLSEDGTILDWSFEDVMRGYDLGVNSPIVDIECFRTGFITKGSPLRGIVNAFRQGAVTAGKGRPLDAIVETASSFFGQQLDNLPKYYIQCRCDLTGDRNANLGFLSAIALGVCLNQVDITGVNDALTGITEITFRQDIADNVYTSAEVTKHMTDDVLIAAGVVVNGFLNPQAALANFFATNDLAQFAIAPGSAAIQEHFMKDSTSVLSGINPDLVPVEVLPSGSDAAALGRRARGIVATRDGSRNFRQNPPLRQGAFGVIPAGGEGVLPQLGTVPGENGARPLGEIPAGIEKLIVQAIIGQNEPPTSPSVLQSES